MCGILAALLGDPDTHVNQLIVDGLTVLQHRGQGKRSMGGGRAYVLPMPAWADRHSLRTPTAPSTDAAGIVTSEKGHLNLRKDNGLVAEVFQQHHMTKLRVSRVRVVGCQHFESDAALPIESIDY